VQRGTARIVGLPLKESQKVRLRRLAPKSVAKTTPSGDSEIVVPIAAKAAEVASKLVSLLEELVPREAS
jgi:hypothetical protein